VKVQRGVVIEDSVHSDIDWTVGGSSFLWW
jgi:hypothetical protein